MPSDEEHVILVAFHVHAHSRPDAHDTLMEGFREMGPCGDDNPFGLEAWWVAEDDRRDGSDNNSAVFVHPGAQQAAVHILHEMCLSGTCNLDQGTYGLADSRFDGTEV